MRRLAALPMLAVLAVLTPSAFVAAQTEPAPTAEPYVDPCFDAAAWWAGTEARWAEADAILADLEKEVAQEEAGPEDYAAVAGRLGALAAEQRAAAAPEAGEELHGVIIQILELSRLEVMAQGVVAFPDGQPIGVVQGAIAQIAIFADQFASLRPRADGLTGAFRRDCGLAEA